MSILPIGTVVLLKDATKRIMITGFFIKDAKNENKVYDYIGCPFPEGVLSAKHNLLFNKDKIQKIYHYGLDDGEQFAYATKLKDYIKE